MLHQLTKKLQHLKKKIKQFEEQFEKEKNYKVKKKTKTTTNKIRKESLCHLQISDCEKHYKLWYYHKLF